MVIQKLSIVKLRKQEQTWKIYTVWFQNLLQCHSNQICVVRIDIYIMGQNTHPKIGQYIYGQLMNNEHAKIGERIDFPMNCTRTKYPY